MQIETQELTTCEVAPDGGAISLGFVDSSGRPATIRLSLNQVGALAMTLPGLIDKALQTRYGDHSLRYAYPLASWMVEQSTDPTQGMVTLRTVDGFSVCFSIPRQQQSELGEALVAHPAIKSVGFTGSRRGGLALIEIAAKRREPIPVFAEMSSINPLFVLPGALAARAESLANGFVDSVTLGVGQFCTNPGLVLALEGPHLQAFIDYAVSAFEKKGAQTMLTPGIAAAYEEGIARRDRSGVERVATGAESDASCSALPALYTVSAEKFLDTPQLEDEIFGPTSLIVICQSEDEMLDLARRIEGQLTATLHMESDDVPLARRLLPILERKAGRILANGFPTGVEVSYGMVHGGPYPATSDSRATSVGAMAIERFLRPVCYQDLPSALLPLALQDDNPLSLWRLRDGELGPN